MKRATKRTVWACVILLSVLVWQTDGCTLIVDQYGRNCWWCCFNGLCTMDCV